MRGATYSIIHGDLEIIVSDGDIPSITVTQFPQGEQFSTIKVADLASLKLLRRGLTEVIDAIITKGKSEQFPRPMSKEE